MMAVRDQWSTKMTVGETHQPISTHHLSPKTLEALLHCLFKVTFVCLFPTLMSVWKLLRGFVSMRLWSALDVVSESHQRLAVSVQIGKPPLRGGVLWCCTSTKNSSLAIRPPLCFHYTITATTHKHQCVYRAKTSNSTRTTICQESKNLQEHTNT